MAVLDVTDFGRNGRKLVESTVRSADPLDMACLLALLAVAFPRVAIVLLWLFSTFFANVYHNFFIPLLGFIFLPLTLLVYTYIVRTQPAIDVPQLVFIFIAVIVDLGLIGGSWRGRR